MSGGRSFPHASTRFFLLFFSLLYPQGHISWNRPSCKQNYSAIEMRFGESSQAAQAFSLGFTCNYGLSYLELTNAPAQPLKSWPRRALRALCAEAPELHHHPSCAVGSSRAQMSLIKKCLHGHLENELFCPESCQVSAHTLLKGNRVQNLGFRLLFHGIEIHGTVPSFPHPKLPRPACPAQGQPREGPRGFQTPRSSPQRLQGMEGAELCLLQDAQPGLGISALVPDSGPEVFVRR